MNQAFSETYHEVWVLKADRNDGIMLSIAIKKDEIGGKNIHLMFSVYKLHNDAVICSLSATKHDFFIQVFWLWNTEHG